LKGKQNMTHTTPPLGPSTLPDTDAEFQKYKDARREGYSIMKALVELKFEAGHHDLSQFDLVIQEHLAMEPIMIAPWRNSVPLTQAACRDGMRLAALEFYREHRDKVRLPGPSEAKAPIEGRSSTDALGQCSAQGSITDEIQDSAINGREPKLSERSQRHLAACNSCRAKLPFWLDLTRALREVNEEDEIIWAAEAGDPAIAHRNLAGGLALFKLAANSLSSGLLLIVDPENWMEVRSVHKNVTRQDFLAMS
jgi:hypothetical protein